MHLLSIVAPCFNEEESVPIFYREILKTLAKSTKPLTFELIFVDDGSSDKTLEKIKELNSKDKRVKFISFSRNFGKESALYAGLKKAQGDFVAVMDVDLQDPPSLILEMYAELSKENTVYDCVATKRVNRKGESKVRSFFAKRFYSIINKISKTEIVDGARDYRLMSRKMVNAILLLKEYSRFSKGIFSWVGFKTKWISYENVERVAGKTSWSFWGLLWYAIEGIIGFSTAPLAVSSVLGFVLCTVAFFLVLFIVIKTLIFGDRAVGYPSLMCAIIFIGGVQLLSIGVLGQYLSKTYLEVKKRPIYVIAEEENNN